MAVETHTAPSEPVRTVRPAPQRHVPQLKSPARVRAEVWTSRTVVNAILAIVAIYSLIPFVWMLIAATKDHVDLFGTPGFTLGELNLFSNLERLVTRSDGIFPRWLFNSFIYTVVGAAIATFISIAAGYAFDKYTWRGKNLMFGGVLIGVLLPGTVTMLPTYLMFSQLNLVNTYWAVLLPSLASPFAVYLARVFSEGYVPDEVMQAARVDGAGEFRTFWSVSLPMMKPAFATLFLFGFTASWNGWVLALYMLTDHELYPVTLGLFLWFSGVQQQPELYSLVIAGSVVALVPLIVTFLILQRFWKSGLTSGAVK